MKLSTRYINMAEEIDWPKLLDTRYHSYNVEVTAYLDSLHIANSSEVSIQKIYEAIKDDPEVDANLKLLYKEAVNGTNKAVKNRMKNRMSNFCRALM